MRKKLVLALICLGLCACGIKPQDVSAPEGADQTAFPKTYPDLKNDPQP
ncbi:MAG: hypothetical protein KDI46_02100 [Alphaproteobacteria bacterium]|nr:hypothetical protein [Alphaproteobacteria bacterium]